MVITGAAAVEVEVEVYSYPGVNTGVSHRSPGSERQLQVAVVEPNWSACRSGVQPARGAVRTRNSAMKTTPGEDRFSSCVTPS